MISEENPRVEKIVQPIEAALMRLREENESVYARILELLKQNKSVAEAIRGLKDDSV